MIDVGRGCFLHPGPLLGGLRFMTVVNPERKTKSRFFCEHDAPQEVFDVKLAHAVSRCLS